ncbi:Putative cell surface protein/ lipoprotein [Minicystis rosea]|nr:Putative cell surface protein/ lipoprotein [Minicystis rosea]
MRAKQPLHHRALRWIATTCTAIACAACIGDPLPPPKPPTVVAGRAYIPHDGTVAVADTRSGALVRNVPLKGYSGSSPAAFDGTLYTGGAELAAVDVATGKVGWTIQKPGRSFHRVAVDAEHVFFESVSDDDSRLGAVDRATGRELWTVATSTLANIVPAGDTVITTNQNHFTPRITARDARSGAMRWEVKDVPFFEPVVSGKRVIFIIDGIPRAARELDLDTGRTTWRDSVGDAGPFAIADGALYIQHGTQIRALDLATKQPRWSGTCHGVIGAGSGFVICAGDKVTAHRADNGAIAWQTELAQGPLSEPVIADGIVSIRTRKLSGATFALDLGSGKLLWRSP